MSGQLRDLGEFAVHDLLRRSLSSVQPVEGLHDDCAVIDVGGAIGALLVNVDRLPRCALDLAPRLAVAQALSDVVCMGGIPLGLMVAIAAPRDMRQDDLEHLMAGLAREGAKYGAPILGGDTKEADSFGLVSCALGRAAGRPIRRSGAKPGDAVVVTCTAGRKWGQRWMSYLDLERDDGAAERADITLPVEETAALRDTGFVTSGTDLSDGLGAALHLMAIASSVAFVVDFERLESLVEASLAPDAERLGLPLGALALSPGYMWENCFTIASDGLEVATDAVRQAGGSVHVIGQVKAGPPDVYLNGAEVSWLSIASDEKFQNEAGGMQPSLWLAKARALSEGLAR